ncbi:MAG: hypothetical protein HC788_05850 [Sphingopyxis sp.]|nr:hypothetical protein [Sphingopyxis sp.]
MFQQIKVTAFAAHLVFCLAAFLALTGTAAAQRDLRYAYPQQLSISPLGVNLQTGRFSHSVTDIAIGDLQLTRTWGDFPSATTSARLFGTVTNESGWSHNFASATHLDQGATSYRKVVLAGVSHRYIVLPDGINFVPFSKSARGTLLVKNGAIYSLTTQSGDQHQFSTASGAIAMLMSTVKADGTRIDYSYDGSWRLRQIRSSRGFAIVLTYDGVGNINQACGFNLATTYLPLGAGCAGAQIITSYGYDGSGNKLSTITDPAGAVVTITGYASGGGPLCITKPNSSTCTVSNIYGPQPGDPSPSWAPPDVVRSQTIPGEGSWTYSYNLGHDILDVPIVAGRPRFSWTYMTDPAGNATTLQYDRGVLVGASTPAGYTNYKYANEVVTTGNITFDYHAVQPSLVVHPNKGADFYFYNNRGQVLQKSTWPQGVPTPTLIDGSPFIANNDPQLTLCCVYPGYPNIPTGSLVYTQTYLPDFPPGNAFPTGCGSGPGDARRCDKPTLQVDAKGNQTEFTYDPAGTAASDRNLATRCKWHPTADTLQLCPADSLASQQQRRLYGGTRYLAAVAARELPNHRCFGQRLCGRNSGRGCDHL